MISLTTDPKIFPKPFSISAAAREATLPVSRSASAAPFPALEKRLEAKEAGTSTIPDAILPAVSAVSPATSPDFSSNLVRMSSSSALSTCD